MAPREMSRSVALLTKIPGMMPALAGLLPGLNFLEINPDEVNREVLKECGILISDSDLLGPCLYALPRVHWVQTTWAGVDTIMAHLDNTKPKPNYPIVRFTGVQFGRMMAEYVVAHLVGLERGFDTIQENNRAMNWDQGGSISQYRTISDMTIGILGVGTIGSKIAQILKMLGARIWGLGRTQKKEPLEAIDEYRTKDGLKELIDACDVLVSVLPDTENTRGLLHHALLMDKKGLVLINIGRGSLITESELIKSLDCGAISQAVLDVFPNEPLPQSSPLWTNNKVKITPHVAAVTRPKDVAEVFRENLKNWENGIPFTNIIQFDRGY